MQEIRRDERVESSFVGRKFVINLELRWIRFGSHEKTKKLLILRRKTISA